MAFSVNPRLSQVLSCANQSQSESTTETTTEASSPQLPPNPQLPMPGSAALVTAAATPKANLFNSPPCCSQCNLNIRGRLVGIHSLNL